MGVLVDYFAVHEAELGGADLAAGPASLGWPYVDCKGWVDRLADLVAELSGRDHSEFGRDELISGGEDGPWLTRVPQEAIEALATVSDERLAEYVDAELLDEHEGSRCTALRDLARSAVEAGHEVYCWSSL